MYSSSPVPSWSTSDMNSKISDRFNLKPTGHRWNGRRRLSASFSTSHVKVQGCRALLKVCFEDIRNIPWSLLICIMLGHDAVAILQE